MWPMPFSRLPCRIAGTALRVATKSVEGRRGVRTCNTLLCASPWPAVCPPSPWVSDRCYHDKG